MLKALLLRSKIDGLGKRLADLKAGDEDREKRAAELAADVAELTAKEDATDEERAAVETAVNDFDAEAEQAEADKADLQRQIDELQRELDSLEEKQPKPAAQAEEPAKPESNERSDQRMVTYKTRAFNNMSAEERSAIFNHPDNVELCKQLRAISASPNLNILIPRIDMPMLTDMIERESKLLKHVNRQTVHGQARQRILGVTPEAVWTEQGGKINEITLSASAVEVDGYKVAGFVPVDNYLLEDNDAELLDAVLAALAKAIAKALDKAIPFGTGTKMPTGFVTAILADNTLKNTNVTNISAANSTGLTLFKKITEAFGAANASDYATGETFWAMSQKTWMKLLSEAMSINAAGAIVSGMNKTMPVLGGAVEIVNIPDNVIVAGFGDLYTLAERQSVTVSESTHVKFLDDQTCFKAVARYDGKPAIPAAFVAIGIDGTVVAIAAATVTFAADTANA